MKQDFSGLSSGKFPGATKLQKVKSSSVVEVLQTINGILKKKLHDHTTTLMQMLDCLQYAFSLRSVEFSDWVSEYALKTPAKTFLAFFLSFSGLRPRFSWLAPTTVTLKKIRD